MTQAIPRRKAISKHRLRLSLISGSAALVFLLIGTIHAVGTNSPTGTVLLPRGADRTIDLSSFAGQTFLQAMQASGTGIFDKTEADNAAIVTIAGADQIVVDVNQFDFRVSQQVFGMFTNGQADFQSLMSNIQGKPFSPQTMRGGIQPFISNSNLKPTANLLYSRRVIS
jgi:hypothetical protein